MDFYLLNGHKITIDKNELDDKWGLILFNRQQNPKIVNVMDIELRYKEYFGSAKSEK